MGTRDPRVDAYIAKAAPFARPILEHLRTVVHDTIPDVEESIKWSAPHFVHHGNLCHMAAFKAHCAFGFWRAKEIDGLGEDPAAMGSFGRIESLDDLPSKRELARFLKAAVALNEAGRPVRGPREAAAPLDMPADFDAALDAEPAARTTWDAFGRGAHREYLEWILEAKREATRASRIAQAVAWIAEGKTRNWKYR